MENFRASKLVNLAVWKESEESSYFYNIQVVIMIIKIL